jgi:Flp pilus assembly protein TadD
MMGNTFHERPTAKARVERKRLRASLDLLWRSLFIGLPVLLSGCHSGFWKHQQQPPSAPQAPQDAAPPAVSVDLTKPLEQSPFRAEVTQDQRVKVHLDFGKVFESQGNYEAALLEYQEGLTAAEARGIGKTRSHEEALAHRRMGNALDRLGRFAQAEVHYKKSLRLSPKDPKIWNDAGYSYYLQGRWADAERTLKSAVNLAPEDQKIKTNLGLVLAAAGRPQEAFKLLSQYSGDAVGHANLGYLLAATGQVDLAREQYRQALALQPSLSLAKRALTQLDRAMKAEEMASRAVPAEPPIPPMAVATSTRDSQVIQTRAQRPYIPPPRRFTNVSPPLPSRSMP